MVGDSKATWLIKYQINANGSEIIELIPGMDADTLVEKINETGRLTARNTGTIIEYMIDEC